MITSKQEKCSYESHNRVAASGSSEIRAKARTKGAPLERHLRDWLIESAPVDLPNNTETQSARPLILPAMKGVAGLLHRRDIYGER